MWRKTITKTNKPLNRKQQHLHYGKKLKGSGECPLTELHNKVLFTGLRFNKVYTHSGTSCPQCVYQI